MRQIHPQINHPSSLPAPVPTAVTVDLREVQETRTTRSDDEADLRRQLAEARRAVSAIMDQLALLVDRRENLKSQLGVLLASPPATASYEADDRSIVAWGFCEDDDL